MSGWKISLRITSPKNSALVFSGQISEDAKNVIVKALDDQFDDVVKQRDELLADIAEESAVREKLATLLAETAVALKGPEAALFRHSWHDLAEVAAGIVKQRDELLAALMGMCGAMLKAMPHIPADHEAIYCGEWFEAAQEPIAAIASVKDTS